MRSKVLPLEDAVPAPIFGGGRDALRREFVFEDVSFRYPKSATDVFSDVSFTVSEGEFFVLLGPSGCGKTTVLNMAAGFEKPTQGALSFAEEAIHKPGPERAVVFQGDQSLLNWLTVSQNVAFALRHRKLDRRKRAELVLDALRAVELDSEADKYPNQLSGGMKQRVQIARALAGESQALLMDEPFGALDAQTRTSLQDQLVQIWTEQRRTVIFITHDISEAIILGDRIGVMTRGPNAELLSIVTNELPRPRDRGSREFADLYHKLESAITEAKRGPTQGPAR